MIKFTGKQIQVPVLTSLNHVPSVSPSYTYKLYKSQGSSVTAKTYKKSLQ